MFENFRIFFQVGLRRLRYFRATLKTRSEMLELTKKILSNVSFDRILFQKELNKALTWISDTEELKSFKMWCIVEFGGKYPNIISRAFERVHV
jgi:hypothetical protein